MISVDQALELVRSNVNVIKRSEFRALIDSHNYILAEDIIAPINLPPFRQSGVDGYGVNLGDFKEYKVIDEIKAGDGNNPTLQPGEAVRIFTGAAVPDSVNAIIMQEKVIKLRDSISLQEEPFSQMNIRHKGEQIVLGEVALEKGVILGSSAIAYLSSLGVVEVNVVSQPKIAVIATGNELVNVGDQLPYGKIYESNTILLEKALSETNYINVTISKTKDTLDDTVETIKKAISNSDLVIITGGISVGDYDFVGKALLNLGVRKIFYKVKQKPGKPLFFGKNGKKAIFALPGNPAAALTCFYMYVLEYLHWMQNKSVKGLTRVVQPLTSHYKKVGERAQFLKAFVDLDGVHILEGQNSSMLYSYAQANALVYISEDISEVAKGQSVTTILLP